MKIKVQKATYAEAMSHISTEHTMPSSSSLLLRALVRLYSIADLTATHFSWKREGMERLGKHEPCLVLMNHSSFVDLKIASKVLFPRPFHIVCTSDGFVGKEWLMRHLGCIPTKKFVSDPGLVRDMKYVLEKLHSSILMYPEASYSFDGTATPLPESLGKCLKFLKVPVVVIRTEGAFSRDPLYNNLQLRKVKVSAVEKYLLSPEESAEKSADELNECLRREFTFDHFRWQQENQIRITEKFRADHLNRVLYRCPHCQTEGQMTGKGISLTCGHCGKKYTLTEYGRMEAEDGNTEFPSIPDWYRWERSCVRQELLDGTYRLDIPVTIRMMTDMKCIYEVGEGRLVHTAEGFHLTGCDGQLDYTQKPLASYSLYSDYYWYELGDMICIGDRRVLYYCFPQNGEDVVAKTRLATEELYHLVKKV